MGWIRISDDFYDNDKLGEVGPLGVALYFAAMGFCNRNLTDGFFKKNKARLFLDFDGIGLTTATAEMCSLGVDGDAAAALVIEWMVAADLWHEYGHDCEECHARADGGEPSTREYLIHDYLKFQPSKDEVEAKAEANRKRVEAFREARKAGKPPSNGVRNADGNALRTEAVQHTPNPTPNPTPSNSSLVNLRGGVTEVDARENEPPLQCSRHINHPDPPSCHACANARRKNEAWHIAQRENELVSRRAARERREACPLCDESGFVIDSDPAVKCSHQEAANA